MIQTRSEAQCQSVAEFGVSEHVPFYETSAARSPSLEGQSWRRVRAELRGKSVACSFTVGREACGEVLSLPHRRTPSSVTCGHVYPRPVSPRARARDTQARAVLRPRGRAVSSQEHDFLVYINCITRHRHIQH
eukprot:scaffold411_cov211-Pinguiococcus_pyrenoidosus.AAC.1